MNWQIYEREKVKLMKNDDTNTFEVDDTDIFESDNTISLYVNQAIKEGGQLTIDTKKKTILYIMDKSVFDARVQNLKNKTINLIEGIRQDLIDLSYRCNNDYDEEEVLHSTHNVAECAADLRTIFVSLNKLYKAQKHTGGGND